MSRLNQAVVTAYNKGYRVDKDGNLVGPKGNFVKPIVYGYNYLGFSVQHQQYRRTPTPIHRLAAYQKYGDKVLQKGMQVRHLNGNRHDNSLANISIGTQYDNTMDMPEEKRRRIIESATRATRKISSETAQQIRNIYSQGRNSTRKLARDYGVSRRTIHNIINNKRPCDH